MENKESWGKRHPIISGLLVAFVILFVIGTFSPEKENNSDSNKKNILLDPLEAEVIPVQGSFTTYQIININNYDR